MTTKSGRPPLPYKSKRLCLSLPETLLALIEREATSQRRSTTQMARVMLQDWFDLKVDLAPHLPSGRE